MILEVHIQSLILNTNFVYFLLKSGELLSFEYVPLSTRNTDSNYQSMERRKNGSLTISIRIWHGNIFPISREQSSKNKI